MLYDYPALEALAAVIREGTFEGAARSLSITQSAVSQRIKLLEEKTGAVLVKRGRPCIPTEHGMKLYRHIDQVQLLEQDLRKTLLDIDQGHYGAPISIRMAVNSDSLATWFPEVVQRATTRLNLYFDIIPDDQEHTAEKLKSGEALAAVTADANPITGCKRIPLGGMSYIPVATPEFRERYLGEGVTLETLSQAPCVFFDRKDTLQDQWLIDVFGRTTQLRPHFVPSTPGYMAACMAGCGWGLVPAPAVDVHLRSGMFTELVPGTSIEVMLYWQSSIGSSEIMRELSNIVADVARMHLKS